MCDAIFVKKFPADHRILVPIEKSENITVVKTALRSYRAKTITYVRKRVKSILLRSP